MTGRQQPGQSKGWSVLDHDVADSQRVIEAEKPAGQFDAPPIPPAPSPRLDPELTFVPMQVAGVHIVRATHPGTAQNFQFGAAEYHVAMLVDGKRTVPEIAAQANSDGLDWTVEETAEFIGLLVKGRLVFLDGSSPPPAGELGSSGAKDRLSVKKLLTSVMKVGSMLISLRFPLMPAAPIVDRLMPLARPLVGRVGMVSVVVLLVSGFGLAITKSQSLASELERVFDAQLWWMLIIIWAVLKVIHELGHAIAAGLCGVRLGKAGVMLFMLAPMAYVDVTDGWRLPRRRDRIGIALAGVLAECLIAAAAVWVWWGLPGGMLAHLAAQVFFVAGPATLLVNANPLLRLDGYFVVSDLTDIPNLRSQGRTLFGGFLEHRLLGVPSPPSLLSGWRRTFAFWHAAASTLFSISWMGGLIIAIAWWAGPLGFSMATAALMLWVVVPVGRWMVRIWTLNVNDPHFNLASHRRRLVWTGLTIALTLQFIVTLPSPICENVPVVVRYADDQMVRSPIDGFIRRVNVRTGDQVGSGQRLVDLDDREAKIELNEVAVNLQAEQIRWQQHEQQGELGLAEASLSKIASLRRQMNELESQLASLHIVAEHSGTVLTPNLHELDGRFLHRGDLVVHIGLPSRKELLISIGDSELEAYVASVRQAEAVPVFLRGGGRLEITPLESRPQASVRIPHPSLPATVGGPLPVGPNRNAEASDTPYELLAPRFEAIVPLSADASMNVRAGEVGQLALQDRRSLFRRFVNYMGW